MVEGIRTLDLDGSFLRALWAVRCIPLVDYVAQPIDLDDSEVLCDVDDVAVVEDLEVTHA